MEKRDADLQKLTIQALKSLESKISPDKQYPSLLVQIAQLPSFDNYVTWNIFSDHAGANFIVKRTEWNKIFDFQRFRDPMIGLKYGWNPKPSISHQILKLFPDTIESLLVEVKSLRIPDLNSKGITLDGTRWNVFVEGGFDNRVMSWNSEPPEWKALIDWTFRFIQVLKNADSGNEIH